MPLRQKKTTDDEAEARQSWGDQQTVCSTAETRHLFWVSSLYESWEAGPTRTGPGLEGEF